MILSVVVPISRQRNNSLYLIENTIQLRQNALIELLFMLDLSIAIDQVGENIYVSHDYYGSGAQVLRNNGLRLAKGRYAICLDDDDRIIGLDALIMFLDKPVSSKSYVLDAYSKYWLFSLCSKLEMKVNCPDVLRSKGNIIGSTSRVVLPSSLYNNQSDIFDKNFEALQDYDAWIGMLENGCCFERVNKDGVYINYKVNLFKSNISSKVSKVNEAWRLISAKHRVNRAVEVKDRLSRALKFRKSEFLQGVSLKEVIQLFFNVL